MHKDVVTTDISSTAQQCADLITRERIGCLIITDNDKPVGIITERNFAELVRKGTVYASRLKVSKFMSSPIISVDHNASFADAFKLFNKNNIKRIPVVKKGKVVGLLTQKNMVEYSHLTIDALGRKEKKLKKEASIDQLTGMFRKNFIKPEITREIKRIQRYSGKSSLLFLDLDHFKVVNDKYSHDAGDMVLAEVGRLIRQHCRQIDLVGRFGGEEFVIVSPNLRKHDAVRFAQRLRSEIENFKFKYEGKTIPLTTSIGIADLRDCKNTQEAINRSW
jgi:diguanylate cyclase (GGDEF)-like protein